MKIDWWTEKEDNQEKIFNIKCVLHKISFQKQTFINLKFNNKQYKFYRVGFSGSSGAVKYFVLRFTR